MSVIRIRDPNAIRPLHVVLIVLVGVTVAGGSWLLSAPESSTLVDGAIAWQQESPLRVVVQLLCLNYSVPTLHAGAVKIYIVGIGAGLALFSLGLAVLVRGRAGDEEAADDVVPDEPVTPRRVPSSHKAHIAPLVSAQVLVGLFLLWSLASSRWSAAPGLAVGGSLLLLIYFLWAFSLGNGLTPAAARIASRLVVIVAGVTGLIAIWYYYGRNPELRAKFPFGNPHFLAACLIPGMVLGATTICEGVRRFRAGRPAASGTARMVGVLAAGVAVALSGWAFYLTQSRGPALGLVTALLAVVFFSVSGWKRLVPVVAAIGLFVAAGVYFTSASDSAAALRRSTTVRFRQYAWDYAWRMFTAKPLTGHGQGGFVLAGDAYAVDDVFDDPEVFEARIAHAHNEWLETLADLGSIGIVLLGAALFLTFQAGMAALDSARSAGDRWVLIGLMSGLVGLLVEETFSVGLRVSGVPTLFYTLIGLIWAMAGRRSMALVKRLSAGRVTRVATGVAAGLAGLTAIVLSQNDFNAARNMYKAEQAITDERFEDAIRLAEASQDRLSPQRALVNLYRLTEAEMLAARAVQDRAREREIRARESDIPNQALLVLAEQDRGLSEAYCSAGVGSLKQLISMSPGFYNHGWLSYGLNMIQADNAHARGDTEARDQFRLAAAAALERELRRQPFELALVLEYLSATEGLLEFEQTITLLARPLRFNRITAAYVDFVAHLADDPSFDDQFAPIVTYAITGRAPEGESEPDAMVALDAWRPEILRVAATIQFRRGGYDMACTLLQRAAEAYNALESRAPLAEASCYAELADSQFYKAPGDPGPAIASAHRALDLAPASLPGRRLGASVHQRLVDYYLAADDETQARRLLEATAPPGTTADTLRRALGIRYRRLCESLLQRRLAFVLRQSPSELFPRLDRWIDRAVTLNPDDAQAHFVRADLGFHHGECEEVAEHLRLAVDHGLAIELAAQFLEVAVGRRPECQALAALWQDIQKVRDDAPDALNQAESVPPTNPPMTGSKRAGGAPGPGS